MEPSYREFLDDTSMSESVRSLVKTSTVAKEDIKWNEDVFFKRQDLAKASESLFLPTAAESPIGTNQAAPRSVLQKFKLPLNYSAVSDGANSSLGILNVENFDLSDSSFQEPIKLKKNIKRKKTLQRSSKIDNEEKEKPSERNEEKYFSESSEVNLDTKYSREAGDECDSGSDIEYDGTNIPELNLDCDILALLSSNKAHVSSVASSNDTSEFKVPGVNLTKTDSKEISDSASSYISTQLTEDESVESDTADRESLRSSRQSIFENFQPKYNSLYEQIVSEKQSVEKKKKEIPQKIKVCPFLGMSSFEVEPILSQQSQPSVYSDVENTRCSQNQSIEFLPEQISARSSSFKSSRQFETPISSSGISNFNETETGSQSNSLYQYKQSRHEEDLENEVLSGSQFQISEHNFQSLSGEEKSIDDKDSGLSTKSTDFEKLSGSYSSKLSEFGNFAFPSNLELKNLSDFGSEGDNWCSRFGIPESDFFSSEAAKEMLRKEREEFEKNQMTLPITNKISSVSDWSLTNQHEITAPSWFTGVSPDTKEAGGRQVSIGTFIGARSESIGTLSEDPDRKRPYFGKVVITPPKTMSSNTDPFASKTSTGSNSEDNSIEKFQIHNISALLEDISTSDPKEFASKLMKKCTAAYRSESKMRTNNHNVLNNNTDFEQTEPCKDIRCALSDIEESGNSTIVKSVSSSNLSKQSDLDMDGESKTTTPEPALCNDTSLNFSVDSSSERGSIKTAKSDTCSNCSAQSSQKFSWPTPCSSACSIPLAMNNALCLQYGSMTHLNSCASSCQNCLHSLLHQVQNSEVPCPHVSCAHPSLKPNLLSASAPNLQSYMHMALSAPLLMPGVSTPYFEIQVTPELNFPEKLSVGDSQKMNLAIHNSSNVGCCYEISFKSAYLNDSPMPYEMSGLNFNKIVSSAIGGVTDTTLILAPIYSGKIVVNLQIDAFLSSRAQALNAAPVSTAKTKIQYEAVRPSITMLSRGKGALNIGQVVAGSSFVEYITVTNNCDVSVPLRISLSNNVSSENQIYFGLNEMNRQMHPLGMLKILSPEVMLYRLPSTSSFQIPLVFESINGRVDSTVTAAIETSTFRQVLAFIKISASSGDAKLVLQDSTQNPLILKSFKGATCNYSVTVMNAGNLSVVYDIHIEGDDVFSVSPNSLNLLPKQCANISVTFSPTTYQTAKGNLLAAAEPHGQVFTLTEIIGQVIDNSIKSLPNLQLSSQGSRNAVKPTRDTDSVISCNRKFIDWGGVEIDGKCNVKTCTIRNTEQKQHIRIYIKDSNQAFLLIDDSGNETAMYDVILKAGEEIPISVAFTPKSISTYSGFLGIITISSKDNQAKNEIKFSLPLKGYGGISKLKILDLPDGEGHGYCLDVDASDGADVVYKNVIFQNVGCRPAFVKLLLSHGSDQNVAGRQTVIHPSEFVLLENEKKNILLSVNCLNKNNVTNNEVISVYYGDEIMRQRLRRWLSSSNNRLIGCNIDFNVPYEGEEKVPCDIICKPCVKEGALFRSQLKWLLIHIFVNGQNTTFSRMSFTGLSECQDSFSALNLNSTVLNLNSTQALRRLTIEDHSPHVKDSASYMDRISLPMPLMNRPSNPDALDSSIASISDSLRGLKIESWTVEPEELIIGAESQEKRILLKSHSNSDFRFRVEYDINVITISPSTGILSANKEIGLRLTLIHTNHNKLFEDYEGFIKILCDKTEKHVHVKVSRDLRRARAVSTVPSMDETLKSGYLGDSYFMDATLVEPVSSYINVENIFNFPKVIDLPKTRQGSVSETVLTVCNPTERTVTWNMCPTTILFSQPCDDSLDSSSAIEFYVSNGTLHPSEKGNIVIKFSPSSIAHFSQFFDLIVSSENGKKQTCMIRVEGDGVVGFPTTMQESNFEKDTKQAGSRKKAPAEIFSESEICKFPKTAPGFLSTQSIILKNVSDRDNKLTVKPPRHPFRLKHSSLLLKSRRFLTVPLYFKPQLPGHYEGEVKFVCENGNELRIKLNGLCSE